MQFLQHGQFACLHHGFTHVRDATVQVPLVVAEAKRALAEGQAVVIGLQATGEAAADALNLEPGQPCGWVSVTREMLQRFVTQHFPTRYHSDGKGGAQCCLGLDRHNRRLMSL